MKKIFVFFLLLSVSLFADYKRLADIETIEARVKESLVINNKKKDSSYILKFQRPNKIKKEILTPELNRGEIYIYNNDEKIVYLPLFDQKTVEKVEPEENEFIRVINYILGQDKENDEFRKDYYLGKIKSIEIENNKIVLKALKEYGGYLLPSKLEIYDGNTKIGSLEITSYQLNTPIDKEEFILK